MVDRILSGGGERFVSFDIFDTLVTRIWFQPRDPFLVTARILASRGMIPVSPRDWVRARCHAEGLAQRQRGALEVEHAAIYDQLARRFGWSAEVRDAARQIEIEVEEASVRPIAEINRIYDHHVGAGGETALISDMYLETPVIERMLDRCGVRYAASRLFVSSQTGHRKHTGALFDHVIDQLGLDNRSCLHVGDNARSDINRAQEAGFDAIHYRAAEPTRYETALFTPAIRDRTMRSAFAGAARAARLGGSDETAHDRALWRIGTNVAGPLLFTFVAWTLKQAAERGLDRLYFVARDGQILLKLARRICDAWDIPIECRYLHGSRQGLHLPGLTEIGDFERGWILEGYAKRTLRGLLARVELVPEDIAEAAGRCGLAADRWDEKLRFSDAPALEALLEAADVQAAILASAAKRRQIALDYLRDEGVLDDGQVGFVDIGWEGRLQRSLSRIAGTVDTNFTDRLHGFYLGLADHPPRGEAGRYDAFCRTGRSDILGAAHYGIWAITEVFTSADHGSLAAFVRDDTGKAWPELLDEGFQEANDWGVALQQSAIEAFAATFIDAARLAGLDPMQDIDGLRAAALQAFERFVETPAVDEAEAFGTYPEFGDQQHRDATELAGRIAPALMPAFVIAPEAFRDQGVWRPGIAVRSAPGWMGTLAARLLRWRRLVMEPTGLRPAAQVTAKWLLGMRRG